jgi:hypothetical protein
VFSPKGPFPSWDGSRLARVRERKDRLGEEDVGFISGDYELVEDDSSIACGCILTSVDVIILRSLRFVRLRLNQVRSNSLARRSEG